MRKHRNRRRLVSNGILLLLLVAPVVYAVTTEAPAGFDNQTNGFEPQANMDLDRVKFDEVEQVSDGLGPVYNAQSCRECHQNPVSGTISQITELRAGSFDGVTFTPHVGGSPIIRVPVLEASGVTRIGRFGWKNQHASLLSFSSDAYLNEMGITNPLNPTENTSSGTDVNYLNTQNGVPAIQDPATQSDPFGADVGAFTRFMRSLKVPPRDTVLAATSDAQAGAQLFTAIGCNICHVTSMTTAPAGTSFNGGQFIVPAALGSKTIHPYSDFLLHDVGTGDFIVQNGGQGTLTQMRTAPLWGMRTRNRLLHDGESITRNVAILNHFGQANPVINNYINLSTTQKNQLITFLNSL